MIGLFFQEPAPHYQITFDDFSKLIRKIKDLMEQYGSNVQNKAKGSHYHPKVQSSLEILGEAIKCAQPLAEEQNSTTLKTTVVKRHGKKDQTLSSDEVKAVRDKLLIPLRITPELFQSNYPS